LDGLGVRRNGAVEKVDFLVPETVGLRSLDALRISEVCEAKGDTISAIASSINDEENEKSRVSMGDC
jgi:hypothetical protein